MASFLEKRRVPIYPKDLAEDVTDFTQGDVRLHRGDDMGHKIFFTGSGLPNRVEPSLRLHLIACRAQVTDAFDLLLFDRVVDLERRD